MRRLRHPSKKRLAAWLSAGDATLEAHIATCERCASRLEDISEPSQPLGEALSAMLAPPEDLYPRLRIGIAAKMSTREDLQLLAELMGLPFQAAKTLAVHDPPRRNQE